MSKHGRVRLTERAMDLARELLGTNPTPARVEKFLEAAFTRVKEVPMPLDDQDRDLGRTVHRAHAHAELLNRDSPENLEAALGNLDEAAQRRSANARDRLQDKIAENEARGLHRNAPPPEEEPVETSPSMPYVPADPAEPPTNAPLAVAPAPLAAPAAPEPADDAAAIDAAKRTGLGRVAVVAESLERRVLQKMPAIRAAGRSLKTLEDAADVLIAELQPNHQDALRQVCQEHGLANWVVLLGAAARMADLQELNAGEFEDAWLNRQSARGTATSIKEEICQMCGGVLPPDPVRKNRVACCNNHGSNRLDHTAGCALAQRQMVKGSWVTVPTPA